MQVRLLVPLLAALCLPPGTLAHHNTQAEYGSFDSPTVAVEALVTDIHWGNPHIRMTLEITGGDLPIGETWTLNSHPVAVQADYGFAKEEFQVGDHLTMLAWRHLRGIPQLWPRAIQVNDGPMKSNLRFTDMIDIAKGSFADSGIQPAANLNGSPPDRAGVATVEALRSMGLLDAEGRMVWPAP